MLQYDVEAGLDPTGLTQITAVQLLQMINQLFPLANIGGVTYQSTTPDVTNNPRFARYLWLDSTTDAPIAKVYDDVALTWIPFQVADGSITAVKLDDYAVSVLNGTGDPKIAYQQNAVGDASKSNFVLRLDANGQYVEVANLTSLIQATSINVNKLIGAAPSDGQVLQWSSSLGYSQFVTLTVGGLITVGSLTPDRFVPTTPGWVLRGTAGTGVPEWVSNNDTVSTLFPVNSIAPSKLYSAVPVAGNKLWNNGAGFAEYTPCYKAPTSGGTTLPAADSVLSVAHGLPATPTRLAVMLVCNLADNGYAAGDRMDASQVHLNTGGTLGPAFAVYADATNVYSAWDTATNYHCIPKTGGPDAAMTSARWNVFLSADI